jgi:hypothetical protein
VAAAQGAVMIEAREAEVFEGKVLEAGDGLGLVDRALSDEAKELNKLLTIDGDLRRSIAIASSAALDAGLLGRVQPPWPLRRTTAW